MRHCLLHLCCALWTALNAQADTTLIRHARQRASEDKCSEALRIVAPLLDRAIPDTDALFIRAHCLMRKKSTFEAGLADLNQLIHQAPGHIEALLLRAKVLEDMRMYQRAEEDLTAVLQQSSDTSYRIRALNRRCWSLIQMRRFKEAEEDARRCLAMDSVNLSAMNNLGLIASDRGDTATAFDWMRRYMALEPDAPTALLNTAFFLSEAGRYKEALVYYERAEKTSGDNARFYNNRGAARVGAGDTSGGLKDIERSIRMDDSNAYAYRNLARAHFAMGDTSNACDALEKALARSFTNQYGNEVLDLRRAHCR